MHASPPATLSGNETKERQKNELTTREIIGHDFDGAILYDDRLSSSRKPATVDLKEDKPSSTESWVLNVGQANLLTILAHFNDEPRTALIDGGAQFNLMTKRVASKLIRKGAAKHSENVDCKIKDVQGNKIKTFGVINSPLVIEGTKFIDTFVIVDSLPSEVLLGRPFLVRNKVSVQHGADALVFKDKKGLKVVADRRHNEERFVSALLVADTSIPPRTAAWLNFRSRGLSKKNETENDIFETKTNMRNGDLQLLTPLVIPDGQTIKVLVANTSRHRVKLSKVNDPLLLKKTTKDEYEPVKDESTIASIKEELDDPLDELNQQLDDEAMSVLRKVKIGSELSREQRKKVLDVLARKHHVLSRNAWDIGRLNIEGHEHKVILKPNAKPKNIRPIRMPQAQRQVLAKILEEMKKANLIRDSRSPWALPLVLVKKAGHPGKVRPVVNARYLNEMQVCAATTLPHLEDLLEQFSTDKNYISKFDLSQFYFQIPLDKESQEICSFSTVLGNFSSLVLLQGDSNSCQASQKTLALVLEGIKDISYLIDDIALATRTFDEHIEAIEKILNRMDQYGLKLRSEKIEICVPELTFMGFKVKAGGKIEVTEDKIERVKKWPQPKTVKEIRQFIAFCSFVRRFIRGFSQIARPLLALIREDVKKIPKEAWNPEVEKSFQDLKKAVTTAPCLVIPDCKGGEFHLFTDASQESIGFVLAQNLKNDENGKWSLRPVAYGSRLFRGAEKNYTIPEKEIVAAVWSIQRNRPYLAGQVFRLHTDSEATYHVLRNANNNPVTSRLARFSFQVADFSFHVHHIKGSKNPADPLSRLPLVRDPKTGELEYLEDETVLIDPFPAPKPDEEVSTDPLFVAVTTRSAARAADVYPGLLEEQQEDEELISLKREVQAAKGKLKKGKFTYQIVDRFLVATDKNNRQRYLVPKVMVKTIIDEEHKIGHPGITKVTEKLEKKFYWPKMTEDIKTYIKSCHTCQVCKMSQHHHHRAPLGELPRPVRGQQVAALDVKGPLPVSREKKRYIIVVVDLFTRYAWTKTAPHVDGRVVADFLLDEVFRFGVFNTIISDNAPNLAAGIAGHLYKSLGIKKKESAPFWPSGNGAVERCIGTIGVALRCATEDDPKGWSKLVAQLTNKYNHTTHRATGYSPFLVHFGYEPREFSLIEVPERGGNFGTQDRYLAELKQNQKQVQQAVLKGLAIYYEDMVEDHDSDPCRKVREHSFSVGQWVLVKRFGTRLNESKSLGAKYFGPAEIMQVDEHNAKLRFVNNGFRRTRNIAHLKLYFRREGEDEATERYTGPLRRREGDNENEDTEVSRGIAPTSPIADQVQRQRQADAGDSQQVDAPARWTASPTPESDDDEEAPKQVTFAP